MVDPGLPDMRASNWPWAWCRGSNASMWVVGHYGDLLIGSILHLIHTLGETTTLAKMG